MLLSIAKVLRPLGIFGQVVMTMAVGYTMHKAEKYEQKGKDEKAKKLYKKIAVLDDHLLGIKHAVYKAHAKLDYYGVEGYIVEKVNLSSKEGLIYEARALLKYKLSSQELVEQENILKIVALYEKAHTIEPLGKKDMKILNGLRSRLEGK